MEANVLIPLISALAGTLIGAFSSIITIWIQQRAQTKREKIKLASEMALSDQKAMYEIVKEQGLKGSLYPIVTYQHFHYEVLNALECGKLTDDRLKKIKAENKKIMEALDDLNKNS